MDKKTLLSLFLLFPALLLSEETERLTFNRDIRPILSEKCFLCHGPDEKANKSDLRLDLRESAIKFLQDGSVMKRITHSDPDERMPPPDSNRDLSPSEIQTVKRWIDEGADYEGHWAYEPAKKTKIPKGAHPVDHFVSRRLATKKVEASGPADRRTLARRLHLDLLGLPPDPKVVEVFVADPDPKAWQKLVDQTLANPHFGERLAVYWLDLVRYADTVGFHGDQNMAVSPYRDYVIRSFNRNLPFDQFTREQIAGDLLENPTTWQLVATAYNRLNKKTNEGGAQDLEYRVKNAADRVRATSTVWMGQTLGCAECHDHKFDPFSQKDFYQFAAFFADIEERGFYGRNGHKDGVWGSSMKVPEAEAAERVAELDQKIAAIRKTLAGTPEGWEAGYQAMLKSLRDQVSGKETMWHVREAETLKSTGGATMKRLEDGSYLSTGKNPNDDDYLFTVKAPEAGAAGFLLEAMPHESLSKKANGRGNGNFVMSRIEFTDAAGKPIGVAEAKASFEQEGWPIKNALNADHANGWAIAGHEKPKHANAYFKFDRIVKGAVTVKMSHRSAHKQHVIGRFRVSVSALPELSLPGGAMPVDLVAAVNAETPNAQQTALLQRRFRDTSPLFTAAREELRTLEAEKKAVAETQRTVLITKRVDTPREVRVLNRGDWMDKTGEVVTAGFPHFMQGLPEAGDSLSRLDLANWLVATDNPLTSRVFVNRLWKLMFDTGLSKVLDDIGSQGEPPTHPELLDWMAVEFAESGWDIKHMLRLILTSETYQRSSLARRDLAEVDPYNRLLARQAPFRITAEFVRDNALSVSGLLNRRIGGPTAKPYQPPGYYRELNFPGRKYAADMNENQFRRGVYTHWQRTFLHPMLKAFDAPDREECTARRDASNTPTQSLVLLNDPTYVEAARGLAVRMLAEGGSDLDGQIDWAFRTVLSRPARVQETRLLTVLYEGQEKQFKEDPKAAAELLTVGLKPVPEGADPVKLAAMTGVARAMLNLHETITRY